MEPIRAALASLASDEPSSWRRCLLLTGSLLAAIAVLKVLKVFCRARVTRRRRPPYAKHEVDYTSRHEDCMDDTKDAQLPEATAQLEEAVDVSPIDLDEDPLAKTYFSISSGQLAAIAEANAARAESSRTQLDDSVTPAAMDATAEELLDLRSPSTVPGKTSPPPTLTEFFVDEEGRLWRRSTSFHEGSPSDGSENSPGLKATSETSPSPTALEASDGDQ